MPDTDIDDNDVSLLCDIGGGLKGSLNSSKLARVIELIATGFVRRDSNVESGKLD